MKKFIAVFILAALAVTAQAQSVFNPVVDVYSPRTLFAGTLMSARTAATTLADTTRAVPVRGLAGVWIGIETAGNDSAGVYVYYRTMKDAATANGAGFTLLDSLIVTATNTMKYLALPSNVMGAYAVQFLVKGLASSTGGYSANPVTTVTTKIIRVPYKQQNPN